MNDEKKLVKMREDDLIIVELDSRFDMSITDPLGLSATQAIIPIPGPNVSACGNINCIAC